MPVNNADTQDRLLNNTTKYTNRIDKFINSYQNAFFKYNKPFLNTSDKRKKTFDSFIIPFEKLAVFASEFGYFISKLYMGFMTSKFIQNLSRLSTPVVNWFWYKFLTRFKFKNIPFYEKGTHFLYALQGGGKSSVLFNTAEHLRRLTGKGVYVNTQFERARYDEVERDYYRFHQFFNETDFWGLEEHRNNLGETVFGSTQLKQFDNQLFCAVMIDELIATFNQRENKSKQYNDVFIGMMRSIVHQRHQNMDRIYFASQIDTTDVQLMKIFKWVHTVEIHLDIPYWEWYMTGSLTKHIMGWYMTSEKVVRKKGKEKVITKNYYIKREFDEEHFETKNMAWMYSKLPVDKINYRRGSE